MKLAGQSVVAYQRLTFDQSSAPAKIRRLKAPPITGSRGFPPTTTRLQRWSVQQATRTIIILLSSKRGQGRAREKRRNHRQFSSRYLVITLTVLLPTGNSTNQLHFNAQPFHFHVGKLGEGFSPEGGGERDWERIEDQRLRKLERELIFRRNKLKLLKIPRQIFETIQKIESNFTDPSPSSKIQTLAIYISRGLKKTRGEGTTRY